MFTDILKYQSITTNMPQENCITVMERFNFLKFTVDWVLTILKNWLHVSVS